MNHIPSNNYMTSTPNFECTALKKGLKVSYIKNTVNSLEKYQYHVYVNQTNHSRFKQNVKYSAI